VIWLAVLFAAVAVGVLLYVRARSGRRRLEPPPWPPPSQAVPPAPAKPERKPVYFRRYYPDGES
jgi:hypothetical protein